MPIKILIADDQPFFRSGIRSELSQHPGLSVIGEASTYEMIVQVARDSCPDVLLLESKMPYANIRKLAHQLSDLSVPNVNIIILTSIKNADAIETALKHGAKSYVLKDEKPLVLVEAIHMVVQGKIWLSPGAAEIIAISMTQKSERALSSREMEILRLLSQGLSNIQVAKELYIAERTVRYDVTKVLNKLGVNNRVEAVAKAAQNGWITV
jgi:DNA-binding NarL/FixJ family response regulator